MAMPAARGLFHRDHDERPADHRQPHGDRDAHAQQLLDALQISRDRVRELRTLPMDAIVKVSRAPAYLGPVKDGRSLPRDPFDPDAPPLSAAIPMILGNTHGETRTLIGRGDPSIFELTWETLQAKLEANSPFMGDLDRGEVIAEYRRWYPQYSPADVFFAATTASRSWRGQVIEAERRAAQPGARIAPGSFSSIGARRSTAAGGARITGSTCRSSSTMRVVPDKVGTGADAQALAARMSDTWIAFARTRQSADKSARPVAGLRPRAARHDGVRPRDAGRRRSARRRTPAVRAGALCSAGHVAASRCRRRAGRRWCGRPRSRRRDAARSRQRFSTR